VSAARGPYLDRQWPYFFPGESNPNQLPASAADGEVKFARGHWNLEGEYCWMLMSYHAIPFLRRDGAFLEAKRTLSPRWYAAVREGYLITNGDREDVYEVAAGYTAATHELVKLGYEIQRNAGSGQIDRIAMLQLVTTVHPVSLAWH
jgi:hypothetical protein